MRDQGRRLESTAAGWTSLVQCSTHTTGSAWVVHGKAKGPSEGRAEPPWRAHSPRAHSPGPGGVAARHQTPPTPGLAHQLRHLGCTARPSSSLLTPRVPRRPVGTAGLSAQEERPGRSWGVTGREEASGGSPPGQVGVQNWFLHQCDPVPAHSKHRAAEETSRSQELTAFQEVMEFLYALCWTGGRPGCRAG